MTCNKEKFQILSPKALPSKTPIKMQSSNLLSSSEISTSVKEKLNLSSCSLKRKRPPQIQIPNLLKEIAVDTQIKFGSSPVKNENSYCFEDLGVGVFSIKGKKKFMEDTHKIVSSINGDLKKGFFGVYDGHGGRKAAEFVAESLHKNVIQMLDNCAGTLAEEEAVKAAYLKTDKEFLEQGVSSGSCCVSVLIEGTKMVVSNLGDCRAVLSSNGIAEALTTDHRVEMEEERKRIEDKGGYVEFHKGAWRVHGILTVSRSIGDAHLKDWVVSEPEITILNLTPSMEFLVLASDGLWEEVGNQEAIDIVMQSCVIEKKPQLSFGDLESKNQKSLTENDDDYACVSTSSSPTVKRVSIIKQKNKTTVSPSYRKTGITSTVKAGLSEFDCESESSSSKLRRISLLSHKSMKTDSPRKENNMTTLSPSYRNTGSISTVKVGCSEFDCENESPPTKLRRTSLFPHKNMKTDSPRKENKRPVVEGLVAACKKLANLAVSRGSMDDITVMLVDLKHFRSERSKNTWLSSM